MRVRSRWRAAFRDGLSRCMDLGFTRHDVARACGVDPKTVDGWALHGHVPRTDEQREAVLEVLRRLVVSRRVPEERTAGDDWWG